MSYTDIDIGIGTGIDTKTILTEAVRFIGAALPLLASLYALTVSTSGGSLSAGEITLVALAVALIATLGGTIAVGIAGIVLRTLADDGQSQASMEG